MDWRFLVPRPDGVSADDAPFGQVLVVGVDARRVAAATALCSSLGVARPLVGGDRAVGTGATADLVVALGSSWPEVRDVLPALRPGGVLYWEVEGRAAGGSVRRRLTAAGLRTTAYWRRRHGEHDTLFLPLEPREAAGWYVSELADDAGAAGRVLRRGALVSATATRRALGALGPRWSYVARRGEGPLTPAVLGPGIVDVPSAPGSGDGSTLLPVVLARGEGEWSRVVLLPFGDRDRRPRHVVKVPRLARHEEATLREQNLLVELAQRLPQPLRESVPRSLGSGRWSGLPVACESFLPGRPVGYAVRGRGDLGRAELSRAATWLAQVHRVPPPGGPLVTSLDDALAVASARAGVVLDDAARHRFGDAALGGLVLPSVYEHGDLTPTNLRLWHGRLSAVDWESARPGRPLTDLLYLLLHWPWSTQARLDTAPAEVFRGVFLRRDGRPAEVARQVVGAYLAELGLPPDVVGPLLMHMLARQAVDRADRLAVSTGATGNLYAELVEVLAATPDEVAWW